MNPHRDVILRKVGNFVGLLEALIRNPEEPRPPLERVVQVFASCAYMSRGEEKPEWLYRLEENYGIRPKGLR